MCVHGSKLDFYPKLFHLYPLLLHLINVSYLNANHLYIKCWRQMGNAIYFNLFYFNLFYIYILRDRHMYWGRHTGAPPAYLFLLVLEGGLSIFSEYLWRRDKSAALILYIKGREGAWKPCGATVPSSHTLQILFSSPILRIMGLP